MEPVGCLLQKSADMRKIEKGPYFKRKSRVILAVHIQPQYTEVTLPSNLPDLEKKKVFSWPYLLNQTCFWTPWNGWGWLANLSFLKILGMSTTFFCF